MFILSIFCLFFITWVVQAEKHQLNPEDAKIWNDWKKCEQNKDKNNNKVNGEIIEITKAPFSVQLEQLNDATKKHQLICGGSVLSLHLILTAAQCLYKHQKEPLKLRVLAGSAMRGEGTSIHSITRMIIHDRFDDSTLDANIAMARVSPRFLTNLIGPTEGLQIAPIKLPSISVKNPDDGLETEIAGWRKGDELTKDLKRINLPIISRDVCNLIYKQINRKYHRYIDKTKVCAWAPTMYGHSCFGHSGGPLYYYNTSYSYMVYGITSHDSNCFNSCRPRIFTNVAFYGDWIDSTYKLLL